MQGERQVKMLRSAPYFLVPDVAASSAYYNSVLGFATEYSAGQPPEFAIVSRDGLGLMLRRAPEAAKISPNEQRGGTWDAFFWVNDVAALSAELVARGADVVYGPLIQSDYRMREMAARDRDGYVLGFGQYLEADI